MVVSTTFDSVRRPLGLPVRSIGLSQSPDCHQVVLFVEAGRCQRLGHAPVMPDVSSNPPVADDEPRAYDSLSLQLPGGNVVPLSKLFDDYASVAAAEPTQRLRPKPGPSEPFAQDATLHRALPPRSDDLDLIAGECLQASSILVVDRSQPPLHDPEVADHRVIVAIRVLVPLADGL